MTQAPTSDAPVAPEGQPAAPPPAPAAPAAPATPSPAPAPAFAPGATNYEWSPPEPEEGEQKPAAQPPKPAEAQPPAQPSPPPPAAEQPPTDAEIDAAWERIRRQQGTDDDWKIVYTKDEKLREQVDRRANSRLANLQQQQRETAESESARVARERKAAEDRQWTEAEAYYWTLRAKPADQHTEEEKKWLPQFESLAGRRMSERAGETAAAITRQKVENELVDQWNKDAAVAAGSMLKTALPFWDDIPGEARHAMEQGTQLGDKEPWLQEYLGAVTKGMNTYINRVRAEAREAGRNEAIAGAPVQSPVVPPTNGATSGLNLSDDDIVRLYSEFDERVSDEMYAGAKKRKGWE